MITEKERLALVRTYRRLERITTKLYAAAAFARSVLAANPVEASERMAIKKLDSALKSYDTGSVR